jgi:hypothetical protein
MAAKKKAKAPGKTAAKRPKAKASDLAAQLEAAKTASERRKLATAIGALGAEGAPAIELLGKLLGAVQWGSDRVDADVKVAFAAADALAAIGEPSVPFLRKWAATKDYTRAQRVAIAIAQLPPELLRKEVATLAKIVKTAALPDEVGPRLAAVAPEALAAFRPLLAGDAPGPAAAMIAHLGPAALDALPDLERALPPRGSVHLSFHVARAIGAIGSAAASAAPALLGALGRDEPLDWAALVALRAIGASAAALARALELARTSKSQRVLLAALAIVADAGGTRDETVDVIRRLTASSDGLVYQAAWSAAAALGPERALPIAASELRSDDPKTWMTGSLGLVETLGPAAATLREDVERHLASPRVGANARRALDAIDGKRPA